MRVSEMKGCMSGYLEGEEAKGVVVEDVAEEEDGELELELKGVDDGGTQEHMVFWKDRL